MRPEYITTGEISSQQQIQDAALVGGEVPAALSDETTAAQVLAEWARLVVDDANTTTEADVERLRAGGLNDREIFEATAFVALRIAFTAINGALGAAPDSQLAAAASEQIRAVVLLAATVGVLVHH